MFLRIVMVLALMFLSTMVQAEKKGSAQNKFHCDGAVCVCNRTVEDCSKTPDVCDMSTMQCDSAKCVCTMKNPARTNSGNARPGTPARIPPTSTQKAQ